MQPSLEFKVNKLTATKYANPNYQNGECGKLNIVPTDAELRMFVFEQSHPLSTELILEILHKQQSESNSKEEDGCLVDIRSTQMQIALCHILDELHIGSIEQHPTVCYQAEGQADVPYLAHKTRVAYV